MDLSTFRVLLSDVGQAALHAAHALQPTEHTLLSCLHQLRKKFPDTLVNAAIETVRLRQKAAVKFSLADVMYFERLALEQASGEIVANHRAQRFAPFERVGDWCCGLGGDLLSLAKRAKVEAVDLDPLRLALAAENVRVGGVADRVEFRQADVLTLVPGSVSAAFCDPDRRSGGQRHLRLRDYQPALAELQSRWPRDFPLGVKVAPGIPWDELHSHDAEAEFISVQGELKECVLWFGPLKTTARRATVLPASVTLFANEPASQAPVSEPQEFLYDPDPAVTRSGLVSNLAEQLEARPLDPDIAYLTSAKLMVTPFAAAYRIEKSLPFHAKRIGEYLRSIRVGHVTITKRGSAVDVDMLRRQWKLQGSETRTVLLTRVGEKPLALIGQRVE